MEIDYRPQVEVERGYSPFLIEARRSLIAEVVHGAEKGDVEDWLLDNHLYVVEANANWILDQLPQADRQDTILGVWFHDIGRVRGHEHKHAKHGAIAAFEYLTGHGYDSDRAQRVHDACKAHSCNDVMPHSLEGQILATADGMSHFMNGFYLRIFQLSSAKRGFEAATERVRNTIEKDYRIKIHFDFARAAVEEQYHAYLRAFSF